MFRADRYLREKHSNYNQNPQTFNGVLIQNWFEESVLRELNPVNTNGRTMIELYPGKHFPESTEYGSGKLMLANQEMIREIEVFKAYKRQKAERDAIALEREKTKSKTCAENKKENDPNAMYGTLKKRPEVAMKVGQKI